MMRPTAILLGASLFHAHGGRVQRRSLKLGSGRPTTKEVAGIPIFNYQLSHMDGPQVAAVQDWVVVFQPGTTDDDIQALCTPLGKACEMVGHPDGGGMPFLRLQGSEAALEDFLVTAGKSAKYVEPDSMTFKIPDFEDSFSDSDSASTAAQLQSWTWGLERIAAPDRATTGRGTHVYVLDTGVRVTHREFEGRAIPLADSTSGVTVPCAGDQACAADLDGHGTHCAGTVGGAKVGVAPGAYIYGMKVFADDGRGSWSWLYGALDFVVTNGMHPAVGSMSLGSKGNVMGIKDSIDAAVAAGVTVVVAAGNENDDACNYSPGFVSSAIAVGSSDSTDRRSWFSNYGSCVDIWGPGGAILSAGHKSDTDTKTLSGTSMACPHVAGAAALLLQEDPSLTPADIRDILLSRASVEFLTGLKEGDTNKLLYVGASPAPSTTTPAPTPAGPCGSNAFGPNPDGDCRCYDPQRCYMNGAMGCNYSATAERGWLNNYSFGLSCSDCACGDVTTPAPTPAPACPSRSTGPRANGDCRCIDPEQCYENGVKGCTYSATASRGWLNNWFFLYNCTGCACGPA